MQKNTHFRTSFHIFCHTGFQKNWWWWGLYLLGRIVHLHQQPGASGDIFQGKFGYDNDDKNDELARVENISGRIMDYEIKGNWGKLTREFIKKGGK